MLQRCERVRDSHRKLLLSLQQMCMLHFFSFCSCVITAASVCTVLQQDQWSVRELLVILNHAGKPAPPWTYSMKLSHWRDGTMNPISPNNQICRLRTCSSFRIHRWCLCQSVDPVNPSPLPVCEVHPVISPFFLQFTLRPHPPSGKWAPAGKYSSLFSFSWAGNLFLEIERKSYFSSRSQSCLTLMHCSGWEHSHSPLK